LKSKHHSIRYRYNSWCRDGPARMI